MSDLQATSLPNSDTLRDEIAEQIAQAEMFTPGLLDPEDYRRFPIYRQAFELAADRIIQMLERSKEQPKDGLPEPMQCSGCGAMLRREDAHIWSIKAYCNDACSRKPDFIESHIKQAERRIEYAASCQLKNQPPPPPPPKPGDTIRDLQCPNRHRLFHRIAAWFFNHS